MEAAALELAQLTDVGREREHNEDSVLAIALDGESVARFDVSALIMVADGVGGHEAGEVASATAIETVRTFFQEPSHLRGLTDIAEVVREIVKEANERVYRLGEGRTHGRPGTTMTFV